ncbi:hypothetical protein GCM10022220_43310 [Actinocatenispora rupis]|uniref:Hsp70 protein n=2 Tax=Actinocatenispora rupis TaxID=519421 RepID=A0A8J3JEU4_9ACTN|nr:hypothetical protein Aru02nite_44520 [Actinocatenispora rupis]
MRPLRARRSGGDRVGDLPPRQEGQYEQDQQGRPVRVPPRGADTSGLGGAIEMAPMGRRLGIDFGTSNTIAVLARDEGPATPLLFDASPLLPSAVFVTAEGMVLTGADAERAGSGQPTGYEPNPKRRIDDQTVWLGGRDVAVVDLVGRVLHRIATEAHRVLGGPADEVVLTHPAAWGSARTGVLREAAHRAGLGEARLVPEPVAAAAYFTEVLGHVVPVDTCLLVYDLGAGTFDCSLVRRTPGGFDVLACDGLPDVGGVDFDAVLLTHAQSLTAEAREEWGRLSRPASPADQRARQALWRNAQGAKELLTRHSTATLHVPLVEREVHVTRGEFEQAIHGHVDRTMDLAVAALRAAAVPAQQVAGAFLVGGSSRVPLVATVMHQRLGIAPTVLDQPELVVAQGSLHTPAVGATGPAPTRPAATGTSAPGIRPSAGLPGAVAVPVWRRPPVLIAAGGLVVVLVVALGLWRFLPPSAPDRAAGVTFTEHGRTNAALFDSTDLLNLAAPWLNASTCRAKPPSGRSTETIECRADKDIWVVDFDHMQSSAARGLSRDAADLKNTTPGFRSFTYHASDPRSGAVTIWQTGDTCQSYWDDNDTTAVAALHETWPGGHPDLMTGCESIWRAQVRPDTLSVRPVS